VVERFDTGVVEHVAVIRRYLGRALLAAALVAAVTFVARSGATPRYEARAEVRLALRDRGSDAGKEADFLAATYVRMASTPTALADAVRNSGVGDRLGAPEQISVTESSTAGYVTVTAAAVTPAAAVRLADAMADRLVTLVRADQVRLIPAGAAPGTEPGVEPMVSRRAEVPTDPVSPRPGFEALLAFLATVIVLCEGAALLRWARGRMPLSGCAGRAEQLLGVPAVTLRRRRGRLVPPTAFFHGRLRDEPVIAVVGLPGRAAAMVATQLAMCSAATRRDTLLADVDADATGPALHRELGLPAAPGLVDVLEHRRSLPSVVHRPADRVAVVTAGRAGTEGDHDPTDDMVGLRRVVASSGAHTAVLVAGTPGRLQTERVVASLPAVAVVLAVDPLRATEADVLRAARDVGDLGGRLVAVVTLPPGTARRGARPQRVAWDGLTPPRRDALTGAGGSRSGRDRRRAGLLDGHGHLEQPRPAASTPDPADGASPEATPEAEATPVQLAGDSGRSVERSALVTPARGPAFRPLATTDGS
jgi:hypothetical protein